ncbi:hypothetical protein PFICI_08592 [Pestalotiopsis fici W106-1]|uniref:Uncharacterized protein n=1 Tax=Pestalotiopsis fici (strain W106-1 / CGMCC3.15140) TaxID=1229662 RepID=W3WY98_PESFW|nr:uncharacterized protein PFICI_08592 [Pestalotiopsis fici W106-1]ETS78739.1 hypothetical protein PFICI_08592 [Pestalotiopsis fici W106-1]
MAEIVAMVGNIVGTGLQQLIPSNTFLLDPGLSEKRSRLQDEARIFLRVLDFNVDEDSSTQTVGDIQASDDAANQSPELSERVTNMINNLPTQARGAVRLYVEQDCDMNDTYLEHLCQLLPDFSLSKYCSPSHRGFKAAASQWHHTGPVHWCSAWSFGFGTAPRYENANEHGLMKLLGFRNVRNTVTPAQVFGQIGSAQRLNRDIMRKARQTCLWNDHQGELNYGHGSTNDSTNAHNLVTILSNLWAYFAPLTHGASQNLIMKLLMLWYHYAHLLELISFIQGARHYYFASRQSLFDSRISSLEMNLMQDMTYDVGFYQDLGISVKNLTVLIESLSSSMEATINLRAREEDGDDGAVNYFNELMADIRGVCADALSKTTDMSSSMEHQLKFLELRREIKQSNSLWILSVLASIFLPLSLASGVLSMGTRFKELGPLLYDFCGVVVLLMTLVFVIIAAIWLLMKITDVIARFRRPSHRIVERVWTSFLICMALLGWGMVLGSFLVGMLDDIQLGGRILGFGMLCLLGLTVVGGTGMRSGVQVIDSIHEGEDKSFEQPPT